MPTFEGVERLPIRDNELKMLSAVLRQMDFFADLPVAQLDRALNCIQLYSFPTNLYLFRKGDPADALYIVYQGQVAVKARSWFLMPGKIIRMLGPGHFFGEMAMLSSSRRPASVVTMTPCKLFVLLRSHFDEMLEVNRSFRQHMMRVAEQRRFENKRSVVHT